jgi:hypothetical protein
MKELIYFPGFEVRDETWLKFALLYFDKLRPIIPDMPFSEDEYLSDSFLSIMNETDLITPYRPQYDEGYCASVLACEEFEKYLRYPERYREFFGKLRAKELRDKWENTYYQTYTLFAGKYNAIFSDFCIENKIASRCNEGILISEDLSFVYMSFLADIISKHNGIEMITDSRKYAKVILNNNQNIATQTMHSLRIAENSIEFSIPSNLNSIPIEKIIQLRKQRSFSECRKAYMVEIQHLIDSKEGTQTNYSLAEHLSYKKDFIKICEHSFDMVAAATVSAYSFVELTNGIQGPEIMLAIATAYMDYQAAKDTFTEIPQFVEQLKNKHMARKYIARIGKLNAPYRSVKGVRK